LPGRKPGMKPPFFLRLLEISIGLNCTVGIEVAERDDQQEIEHAGRQHRCCSKT
jgi:hypothetical protein